MQRFLKNNIGSRRIFFVILFGAAGLFAGGALSNLATPFRLGDSSIGITVLLGIAAGGTA